MSEQAHPTAGETARSLQEVARLFADETATLPLSRDYLVRFAEDVKALTPCLEELVSYLADEGNAPVCGHDQWLYQIDTAVLLLDQIADARSREHAHVVHTLLFTVETLLHDVTSYAQLALGVPLTLPQLRQDNGTAVSPRHTTVH